MKSSHAIWIAVVVFVTGATWCVFTHGLYSSTSWTCVHCRVVRHWENAFGRSSERIEESEYSSWYGQQHPTHVHQWGWSGSTITHYPVAIGRACGERHPIWEIKPEMQRWFVERATAEELQDFYTALGSADRAIQGQAVEQVYEKVLDDPQFWPR